MPRLRCALAYRGAARTAMRYCSQASCGSPELSARMPSAIIRSADCLAGASAAGLRVEPPRNLSSRFVSRISSLCSMLNLRPAPASPASRGRLLQRRFQELPHLGGVFRDLDAALFHDRQLLLRRALAAGDDGAGVPHPLAWGSRNPGDKADDG